MANGTTMNAALFEALRDIGVTEENAAKVAKTVPPAETIATKAELRTEIQDVRAAIPAADTLPNKAEVEVLKAESETTKGGIKQILVRQGEIEQRLTGIEKEMTDIKAGAKFDRKLFIIVMSVVLSSLFSLLGFVIKIAFFS